MPNENATQKENLRLVYFYAAFATVGWGTLFVASKYALASIPSFSMLFLRYAVGLLPLLILLQWEKSRRRKEGNPVKKVEGRGLRLLLLLGVLGYFVAIAFQFLATARCSASLSSLLNSTNPVVIILLAIPLLREKPSWKDWLVVGITLAGVVVIIGDVGEGNRLSGIVFATISVALWSLFSVLVRFINRWGYTTLQITVYGMGIAAVLSLPIFLYQLFTGQIQSGALEWKSIFSVLWVGLVATAGSLTTWNKALELGNAATCSFFYPLQPLTSAVLGIAFLGETLSGRFLVGGSLILGGVVAAVLLESKKGADRNNPR